MKTDLMLRHFVALAATSPTVEASAFGKGHNLQIDIVFAETPVERWPEAEWVTKQLLQKIDHKHLQLDCQAGTPQRLEDLPSWLAQNIAETTGLMVRKISLNTGSGAGFYFEQDGEK